MTDSPVEQTPPADDPATATRAALSDELASLRDAVAARLAVKPAAAVAARIAAAVQRAEDAEAETARVTAERDDALARAASAEAALADVRSELLAMRAALEV